MRIKISVRAIEKRYFNWNTYLGIFNIALLVISIWLLGVFYISQWSQVPGQEKYAAFELEKGKIYIALFVFVVLMNVVRVYVQRRREKTSNPRKAHNVGRQ